MAKVTVAYWFGQHDFTSPRSASASLADDLTQKGVAGQAALNGMESIRCGAICYAALAVRPSVGACFPIPSNLLLGLVVSLQPQIVEGAQLRSAKGVL